MVWRAREGYNRAHHLVAPRGVRAPTVKLLEPAACTAAAPLDRVGSRRRNDLNAPGDGLLPAEVRDAIAAAAVNFSVLQRGNCKKVASSSRYHHTD